MEKIYRNFYVKKNNLRLGFTLIELIVVITMLAILSSILIGILDPLGQIEKSRDANIQHDLSQIQVSLDAYYNDNKCYPLSVPFNSSWNAGSSYYMKKVPEDYQCSQNLKKCYSYQTDSNSSCPSWNVVFASLRKIVNTGNKTFCSLENLPNCLPTDYKSLGYNYCLVSGTPDCSYISTHSIGVNNAP